MAKKKIVLVGPLPPPLNGQTIAFSLLVEALKNKSVPHNVINLIVDNHWSSKITLLRIKEYIYIIIKYSVNVLFNNSTVYLTISQSKYGFYRDAVMILLATLKKHKIICHLHGGNYDQFFKMQPTIIQKIIKYVLSKVTSIIILGESLKYMFNFDQKLLNRLLIIPNGIGSTQASKPNKKIDRMNVTKILFLSNLIESKGYFTLLKAIDILINKKNVLVECHFCGEFLDVQDEINVHENATKAKNQFFLSINKNNLSEYVFFHGSVSGLEKRLLLENAHFLVLPTNYINEGQPLSIIEGMSYGCVVLSTNYRSIPDLIEDKKSGFFIRHDDPESIVERVIDCLDNPQQYTNISNTAFLKYSNEFTKEKYIEKLCTVLEAL